MPRMQGSNVLEVDARIEQRLMSGLRVVKYALAAFRYLVTGIVAMVLALLLVLLIVELGAVIGTAIDHEMLASRNCGGSVMRARLQVKAFFEGTQHAEDQFQ